MLVGRLSEEFCHAINCTTADRQKQQKPYHKMPII